LASAHLLLSLSRSPHPPRPTLFPYTTLFRSVQVVIRDERDLVAHTELQADDRPATVERDAPGWTCACGRSAGPAPLSTATPAVTTMTPPESSSGSSGWEQAASSAISTTGTRTFSKRRRPRPLHSDRSRCRPAAERSPANEASQLPEPRPGTRPRRCQAAHLPPACSHAPWFLRRHQAGRTAETPARTPRPAGADTETLGLSGVSPSRRRPTRRDHGHELPHRPQVVGGVAERRQRDLVLLLAPRLRPREQRDRLSVRVAQAAPDVLPAGVVDGLDRPALRPVDPPSRLAAQVAGDHAQVEGRVERVAGDRGATRHERERGVR